MDSFQTENGTVTGTSTADVAD